jgi:putative hemolysin
MPKLIDIEKVFKEKNPRLYRWTPKFLVNYIKKLINEDRINQFQERNNDVYELDFCAAAIAEIGAQVSYEGLENIPEQEPFILVSNHPLGGLDGMALIQVVGKKRTDIEFLVNDILTNFKNFGRLFVPVNKIGANASENLKRIENIYATSTGGVMLFPAGLVSREMNDGSIQDLEWNKSFVTRAIKYQKNVIPVHIQGRLSNRFYRIARWRKKLGIKLNIEMMFLADEMFKQADKGIHFVIGKPIAPAKFTSVKKPKQWAEEVRRYIYTMDQHSEF